MRLGKGKISLSKKVKNSVKGAIKFITQFEDTVCSIAADNDYDYVICGHIHQPEIRKVTTERGEVTYLNSGDWIENLTSLEYTDGQWRLYRYYEDTVAQAVEIDKKKLPRESARDMMDSLIADLNAGVQGSDTFEEEGLGAVEAA
jgi:hypothetical protein